MLSTPSRPRTIRRTATGLGRTRPRRLTVLPDGSVLADRVISKVRADESGHGGAERRLIALGARHREAREPGREWLAEALAA
ncbi:MAG: hypothetical protein JWO67_3280, partial [Streptosporangiaceae bacterium]|nr:hypothetical protein [Streptosporangiaceae bacterium]